MSVVDLGVTNMCRAVNIEGVAVKATFCSRICVGGEIVQMLNFFYQPSAMSDGPGQFFKSLSACYTYLLQDSL